MCEHATTIERANQRHGRRGTALVSSLIVFIGIAGLLYASAAVAHVEVKDSRHAVDDVRTAELANAGIERGLLLLRQTAASAGTQNPLGPLTGLFAASPTITPISAQAVMDGASKVGAYTVSLTTLEQTTSSITIAIQATGYLPDAPANLGPNEQVKSWRAVQTNVRYQLAPSKVFDYGYFINNWGWFYGDTIYCNGNARSNGQFDAAGYQPTVTGQPLFDASAFNGTSVTLSGYADDNNDGLSDGGDGGVFAGWDIIGAQNMHGNGGKASNQHEFDGPITMPNLSDLSNYESAAKAQNASIQIAGTTMANAVYGDEPGEKQNLYLVGTALNPIVLNGPVVVRGDLVISGYVTGQGAIYSGGNVYVPNSVIYKDPPTTARPADNSQATTEAWMTANWNKDFMGLFAKENIVVGDCTDPTWQAYVGWWMGSSMNKSKEDAGEDGIPNTKAGKDGILGTVDDDLLEDDGVFTVDHYTSDDADLGLIPAGKSVGDAIPGTGEDIDGDGVFDDTSTLANVTLAKALNTTNFGGNMPVAGIPSYNSIASVYANRLDAVLYTNHSFCWLVLGGADALINGALVSRNENIIYGTPAMQANYDCRLIGGNTGKAASMLPQTLQQPEILRWTSLDFDPNRHLVTP
ncbi:MAG: hypothetical protein K8S98_11100 [Planctomycetes bacterium]|nr:hypothetical protein [Planctomycetota bacterium]